MTSSTGAVALIKAAARYRRALIFQGMVGEIRKVRRRAETAAQ